MNRRYCVIRRDQELYVIESSLTAEEREEVAERKRSPEARRRFGTLLRRVRRAEDAPLKAAIRILRAKGDPNASLTPEETEACLAGAPEHIRKGWYDRLRREPPEEVPQGQKEPA